MIIVNTSHQIFENKNNCGELIVSTTNCNINCFVHKHLKNSHKSFQKFKTTRTRYFIKQRTYLNISPVNRQKHFLVAILDNLIEWIFVHDEVLKTSLVEKTGSAENGGKKWRYNGDIFLLLDKNSKN